MASQDAPVSPLCALCHEFAHDVIRFAFTQPDEYPTSSRWLKDPAFEGGYLAWKDGFRHHNDLASLAASVQAGCALCRIVHDELMLLGPDDSKGFVVFHPFSGFTFRFRDSPSMQNRPAPWTEQPRLYEFCQRRSRLPGVTFKDSAFWKGHIDPWRGSHAISGDGASEDVFDTARWWLKSCVETHGDVCKRPVAPLPTRVVDVGVGESCNPSLYISAGEYEPCAILTHCWGGGIPFKTTKATLQDRVKGMEMSQLPKNFQDAVMITRRLGLRYVWIDALCIIQDDLADWRREAAKMADTYAAGTVTISALDSPSSETGILHRRRVLPEVVLSSEYTVRKKPRTFERVLADCPLHARAWCFQEKLLSPALLHFGSQQIFWECRYQQTPEVAPTVDARYNPPVGVVRPFMGIDKYVSPEGPFWALWYNAVEAFSMRDLTFVTDKFPALAGVGFRFRQQNGGGTYAAGLWVEDLAQGICWGPAWDHLRVPNRKAPGFDRCEVLRKLSVAIAPSWSWASVDGRVSFSRANGPWEFTILNVDMVHHDDLMAERSLGTLTIQGRFARVWYLPDSHAADTHQNIGRLVLQDDDTIYFTGAMLDFERDRKKECWAMVTSGRTPGSFKGLLLFEEQGSHFVRIGFCSEQYASTLDIDKFAEMTITVV